MEKRVKRIQDLFKARFGVDLPEQDLYGNIFPRLIKQMDEFLMEEISDKETVKMADFLSQRLHGKAILKEKERPAHPSKIKHLEEPGGDEEHKKIQGTGKPVGSKPSKRKV